MPPRASEAARVRTDRRAGFRFCMMLSCLSASTVTMFRSVVVARGVVHGIVDCFGPHARGHHLVEEFPTHLLRALVERAGCGRLGPVALGGVDVGGHEPGTEAGDPTPVSRGACGESAGRGHSTTQRVLTTPAPARPLGNGPFATPRIHLDLEAGNCSIGPGQFGESVNPARALISATTLVFASA